MSWKASLSPVMSLWNAIRNNKEILKVWSPTEVHCCEYSWRLYVNALVCLKLIYIYDILCAGREQNIEADW